MSIFKGASEPKSIYYGLQINDMKGPCDVGFHIPLQSELTALYNTGVSLGAWTNTQGTNFSTYLKMPMGGARVYNTGNKTWEGTAGLYRGAEGYISNNNFMGRNLYLSASSIATPNGGTVGYGDSIRPFKDTPIIPDSNWTTLYQGTGAAGIYHNPTLGLISLSSDGSSWITIADKNLGATTVYNYGDTLSQANCGKLYQRGNNYGFDWSGAITTDSSDVNASSYGPGNYYESNKFITANPRDRGKNTNLRGGDSQGTFNGATDIKKVYLGTTQVRPIINFATQGPSPKGFHVPLSTERQAVRDIRVALGGGSSDGTNFGIALKLPLAGRRYNSSADVGSQGSSGGYWSSSRNGTNYAYRLSFSNTSLSPQSAVSRANGFSVRCFKNSPTVPTSSWTKLYGTSIEAGGIFWSSTDGLISLSSDGDIWITIQDKNLGATTVWNSGDTLSEANCGKYYQRGNNYGFPRTGTIENQSTTQVDASNYGPGNYYSSDTFIKYSGSRDSSDNGNLWGGEDGNVPV